MNIETLELFGWTVLATTVWYNFGAFCLWLLKNHLKYPGEPRWWWQYALSGGWDMNYRFYINDRDEFIVDTKSFNGIAPFLFFITLHGYIAYLVWLAIKVAWVALKYSWWLMTGGIAEIAVKLTPDIFLGACGICIVISGISLPFFAKEGTAEFVAGMVLGMVILLAGISLFLKYVSKDKTGARKKMKLIIAFLEGVIFTVVDMAKCLLCLVGIGNTCSAGCKNGK